MIMAGAFTSGATAPHAQYQTMFAALGVIFAAVYMLHAVLKMFWGPLDKEENKDLQDINRRELTSLAPLLVLIFWIGLYPATFLDRMTPAVNHFLEVSTVKRNANGSDDTLRLLDATAMETAIMYADPDFEPPQEDSEPDADEAEEIALAPSRLGVGGAQ